MISVLGDSIKRQREVQRVQPVKTSSRRKVRAGFALAGFLAVILALVWSFPAINEPLPSFEAVSNTDLELVYPPDLYANGSYADLPHGRTRFYNFGSPDPNAERVVLVHGIGPPCVTFHRLAKRLSTRYRVLVYDLYGRGYSSSPGTLHDESLYVTQLALLLDHVGNWQDFHLVGYSMGGAISASFAHYFGHRLRSLVLIAPAGLMRGIPLAGRVFSLPIIAEIAIQTGVAQVIMNRNAQGNFLVRPSDAAFESFWARVKRKEFDQLTVEEEVCLLRTLTALQVKYHIGFARSFLSTLRYYPLTVKEGGLCRFESIGKDSVHKFPVLAIWGTRDSLIPLSLWTDLKNKIPRAKLVTIEDAGHSLVTENSTAVFEAISAHISML